MRSRLFTTLVTDGPRDQILAAPLSWLLVELAGTRFEPPRWADPRLCRTTHKDGLERRLRAALDLYGCDLLFVHRDAEDEPREKRKEEIEAALQSLQRPVPAVCVVPVRMSEAWFLFEAQAIRRAANNPSSSISLDLPTIRQVESLKNPKETLRTALRTASGLKGRRLEKFQDEAAVYRLSDFVEDYTPLSALPAFAALKTELALLLEERGWIEKKQLEEAPS